MKIEIIEEFRERVGSPGKEVLFTLFYRPSEKSTEIKQVGSIFVVSDKDLMGKDIISIAKEIDKRRLKNALNVFKNFYKQQYLKVK